LPSHQYKYESKIKIDVPKYPIQQNLKMIFILYQRGNGAMAIAPNGFLRGQDMSEK